MKTEHGIQEQASVYSRKSDPLNQTLEKQADIRQGFIAGAKWMQEQDNWISVEDRLPEIGQEVIVYCPDCRREVTALCRLIRHEGAGGFYWDNSYGGSNIYLQKTVTHWQPLPSPPKI